MKKAILIYGVIYGILGFLNSYLMINNSVGIWTAMGLSFIIFIVLCVLTVFMYRKESGKSGFKEIFSAMMLMGLIGTLITMLVTQVYASSLSAEAITTMEENFIDSQLDYYESLGIPDEQINELEDTLTEQFSNMFSLKAQLISLPISMLFLAIIALIISLIMKKEENPLGAEV